MGGLFYSEIPVLLLRSGPDEHQTAETVLPLQVLRGYSGVGWIELDRCYLRWLNYVVELCTWYTLAIDPDHRLAAANADDVPAAGGRSTNQDARNSAEQVARIRRT
jgi:hypothetical protein